MATKVEITKATWVWEEYGSPRGSAFIKDEGGNLVVGGGKSPSVEKAHRIVAAVNATSKFSTEALEAGVVAEMVKTLSEVSEYLDRFSDVQDGDDGQPEANDAMRLKQAVDALLSKLDGRAG